MTTTYGRWQRTIVNGEGTIQPGATVEVRQDIVGAPLAVIYSDRFGATPISNPMTADAITALAAFYAAGGAYKITASFGGESIVWRYVGIGTAAEHDFTDFAGINWIAA